MPIINEHGQTIGEALPAYWTPPKAILPTLMKGTHVRIEPLSIDRHIGGLWEAMKQDQAGAGWTYMTYGPFPTIEEMRIWMEANCRGDDPLYFAFISPLTQQPIGWASYLRIKASEACVEVGSVRLSPLMQRTVMATEAMSLMMAHAFELGFRRYEWKCDALNIASRKAAERIGFTFEGIFRNATHYKGRSRDTAWFSVVDSEWPKLRKAHTEWLAPTNFDTAGQQKVALSEFIKGSSV